MRISPEQLRAARGWLGWSRQELAARSYVARHTIYNFEHDDAEPSDDIQTALCMALHRAHVEPTFSRGKPFGIRVLNSATEQTDVNVTGIFPEQIRAARGWLNWTAQNLADDSGVGHQTIAKYERGAVVPSIEIQAALCSVFTNAGIEPVYSREGDEPTGIRLTGHIVPYRLPRARKGMRELKRYRHMVELREKGESLQAIGDVYDISRERVRQILEAGTEAVG